MIETKELDAKTSVVLGRAESMEITNNATNTMAATFLKGVKGLQAQVKDTFRPHISTAHGAWKALIAEEKSHLEPLEEAERIVKGKVGKFYEREEIERQKAQKEADEKARKAEEKRKKELEEQAKNHEDKGREDKAEERRAMAEEVHEPAPVIENQAEKQEGIIVKEVWDFEILRPSAIPTKFLTPDLVKIRKYVRAMKEDGKIDGVRIFKKSQVDVRG